MRQIIDDRSDFHRRLGDLGQDVGSLTIVVEPPEAESETQATEKRAAASAKTAKKPNKK